MFVERRSFLFDIVSNRKNSIDVDKWDYLARDALMCNRSIAFDFRNVMGACKVRAEGRKEGQAAQPPFGSSGCSTPFDWEAVYNVSHEWHMTCMACNMSHIWRLDGCLNTSLCAAAPALCLAAALSSTRCLPQTLFGCVASHDAALPAALSHKGA